GIQKPFGKVIWENIGYYHPVRQPPIIFIRQVKFCSFHPKVLASLYMPSILTQSIIPIDAFKSSLESYLDSNGTEYVCKSVTKYIEMRDGYELDHNNIVLSNGTSSAIKLILYKNTRMGKLLVSWFHRPISSLLSYIAEFSGKLISYYLDKTQNWGLN
ncbi:hypothetical protein MXB_2381, partial [Myxobolus squamalis]